MRKVDSFGTAKIGDHGKPFRARLIQINETVFGLFPESDDMPPTTLTFSEEPRIRGRVLSGQLHAEGPTSFSFARASCGCQTPMHLRGPARKFLAELAGEPASA